MAEQTDHTTSQNPDEPDREIHRHELWEMANRMRELESGAGNLTKSERLARYKRLREELEAKLAEAEGRKVPTDDE